MAVALGALYMGINVWCNYGGNVTGLFYTGRDSVLPKPLEAPHTRRVDDPRGYDGQYYHLAAHDPFMIRGFQVFADNPRLRWRRIGVPGLAALASLANDRYIDIAYIAVELMFLFAGTAWLGAILGSYGLAPAWGLTFLAIPAVLVSVDRMTVDLALAALLAGLVYYSNSQNSRRVCIILGLAPLIRETGLLLVVGWCLWKGVQRRWRQMVAGSLCAIPALTWWIFVARRTSADATPWLGLYPFSGLIDTVRLIAVPREGTAWLRIAAVLESVALAGIVIAIGCGIYLAIRRRTDLLSITAIVFIAFAALLGKGDIWDSAYATGRTMSPLLIVLGLIAARDRRPLYLLPGLLVVPRILLQYEAQLRAAARAVMHS